MTVRRFRAALLTLLFCAPASAAFANPITTHPLKMRFSGGFQVAAGELEKGKVGNREIINIAQGRDIDSKPPSNEILAVTIDCATGDAQVVVWNTATDTQIVAVSTTFSMTTNIAIQDKNGASSRAFSIGEFDWNALGNATWGLTGGTVAVAATIKYRDLAGTVCPSTIKANLVGTIEVVVEGDALDLLAIKGKSSAKKPVHVVP